MDITYFYLQVLSHLSNFWTPPPPPLPPLLVLYQFRSINPCCIWFTEINMCFRHIDTRYTQHIWRSLDLRMQKNLCKGYSFSLCPFLTHSTKPLASYVTEILCAEGIPFTCDVFLSFFEKKVMLVNFNQKWNET